MRYLRTEIRQVSLSGIPKTNSKSLERCTWKTSSKCFHICFLQKNETNMPWALFKRKRTFFLFSYPSKSSSSVKLQEANIYVVQFSMMHNPRIHSDGHKLKCRQVSKSLQLEKHSIEIMKQPLGRQDLIGAPILASKAFYVHTRRQKVIGSYKI